MEGKKIKQGHKALIVRVSAEDMERMTEAMARSRIFKITEFVRRAIRDYSARILGGRRGDLTE